MERKGMYWSDEESDTDVSGVIEDDMEKLEISIDESFKYLPTGEYNEINNFATSTNQVEPCMNIKEETEDPDIAMELQTSVNSTPKMETEEIPYASLPVVANSNIKEENEDHGIITDSTTQKSTYNLETIEIPGTSIPIAERNTGVQSRASVVEKKKAAPILRRSARISRMKIQPVDENTKVSETQEKVRLYMSKCYVVLTKLEAAEYNKHQHKSRTPLRRSLRNIQHVYNKENEDDVDDNAALPPLRKSQAKKIARVPKAKTPQPSQRITSPIRIIASVQEEYNVERIKRELHKLDAMNLEKQLASVMEKVAKDIANIKGLQLRRRSMVHEPINVGEHQQDPEPKSVNISKTTKPRLTRKLKKWFMEEDTSDEENITIHAKPSRRSLRTRTCDTDIILPQPGRRVTRSMTRNLAAASQTAGRAGFPKRRCSIHTTCFNYNAMY